jgi:adenylate kinase family enzyme
MTAPHIHITGASGAGVTTLGRALAKRLGAVHLDTDDFYWSPAEPRYSVRRSVDERLRLLRDAFVATGSRGWILSGAVSEWADPIANLFDLVVFVTAPTEVRLKRLRERERVRFGDAVLPGGSRHREHEAFIEWAAAYESGTCEGRSLPRHEVWLAERRCPVLRLDGTLPVEALAEAAVAALNREP